MDCDRFERDGGEAPGTHGPCCYRRSAYTWTNAGEDHPYRREAQNPGWGMLAVLTPKRVRSRLGGRARVGAIALVIGVASLCLMIGTGLTTSSPHGAGDNGDGVRLYCGAGIVPTTPDKQANWKGVVVDTFRTGEKPCARYTPSSALLPMLATAPLSGPTWSLRTLGWTWVGVLVAAFGIAATVAGASRPWRALAVVPVVLPFASTDFSRFLLSTYGEPAGLVGTAVALAGVVAAVAGPPRGPARSIALAVAVLGGVLAATAKPAYVVVLIPVLVLCVAVQPAGSRLLGALVAVAVALGAAVPVTAAMTVQDEQYAANTHRVHRGGTCQRGRRDRPARTPTYGLTRAGLSIRTACRCRTGRPPSVLSGPDYVPALSAMS